MVGRDSGDDLIRVYQRREALPETVGAGAYVVLDVMYFSTTVIELLAAGATFVHVPAPQDDPATFRTNHPTARIGDEGVDRAMPRPDYDFFNSPTSARAADVAGRPVSLASFNGARTVATLRERGVEDIYVGSTTNAAAVAQRVQDTEGPIHLVCAGSQGSIALEDLVGALLVVRHLRGDEPNLAALAHYHDLLVESRRPLAGLPEIRRRDLADFVTRIDSRSIVPRLDDAGFVDDATDHATPAPSGSGRTASRS